MLLTLSTTHRPATDLGYLLHKRAGRVQSFPQSFGQAQVFYPEASEDRCTAAMLLDVDPIGLVRGRRGRSGGGLDQYVNDRPYAASSFMSVAIADVFSTALAGRSRERQELADTPIPLAARIAVLPCRGGEELLRRLFEPLGYQVKAARHPLDEAFPGWGDSQYYTVELQAVARVQDLLAHLYVLIPVLDDRKHYYVGDAEVEKLLRHGERWLAGHPEREMIARRYLKYRRHLSRGALARLADEDNPDPDAAQAGHDTEESLAEDRLSLHEQRIADVLAVLRDAGAKRVIDLGCGEGRLLKALLGDRQFTEIVGMDVSLRSLEIAADRLHLDRVPPKRAERVRLIHGSLTYHDPRIAGFDAAAVVEVIEHLDPPRLGAFERIVFEKARPAFVVITTPNVEYNVRWPTLPAGRFRHRDHRFEWTRAQFQTWSARVTERFGYEVRHLPVGPEDPEVGPPTQMAVFEPPRVS